MSVFIYGYKPGSVSVNSLKESLGARKIRTEGSRYRARDRHTIVNWGASSINNEQVLASRVLNHPEAVAQVSNKLTFFRLMDDLDNSFYIPEWSDNFEDTLNWDKTVARTVLQGHSGNGIVIIERGTPPPPAPLYTKYIPKQYEYRVHVCRDGDDVRVFDVQRKARNHDVADEDVDWNVRSHANGFIYARNEEGVQIPTQVTDAAKACFSGTGLDFGAVDVVYNRHRERAYVLEINTAPGLTGTTLDQYTGMLQYLIG